MSALQRGERPSLSRSEKWLAGLAWLLAAVSFGFGALYVDAGLMHDAEFPYVVNSVAKDFLLVALGVAVARDVRRFAASLVPLIVGVHVVMAGLLLAGVGSNEISHTMNVGWFAPDAVAFRWLWFAAAVFMAVGFSVASWLAVRSRYGLQFLWPGGYRALTALAEVLVLRKDPTVAPAEVGERVDRYLASFRATEKWKLWASLQALAYWPLLTLHPPFHLMSADRRQTWVQRRFLDQTRDWLTPRAVRDLRRAMIRTAQQLSFMGYYADPRAAEAAGYVPFSRRTPPSVVVPHVNGSRRRVECMTAADVGDVIKAQIVIVGSGAAGAMLAHELAARGKRVLVLERGSHVDPSAFTENEADQLAKLYRDGALTLTKDYRFQVAQGMCVGGSTVVNNSVCFDLPDSVRDRWNGEGEAGLDPVRLAAAFHHVRTFLKIGPLGPPSRRNPGAEHMVSILNRKPAVDRPLELTVADCNITGCLGCGYCNLGCQFGKKLSALDWTLPEAQRKYPGSVQVLADCFVEKVLTRGGFTRTVRARLPGGRRVEIRASEAVVLSAGALASSVILQRSGLGGGRAGKALAFNMASPVTLDFGEPVHSERGAQISHYYEPPNPKRPGLALETWFNPIVTQSLFMPGWFDQHWDNMRGYANMTCLGVVVGTASNGSVKPGFTRGGLNLDYSPTDEDFLRIKHGVQLACEIGLRLDAKRVMPATFHGVEVHGEDELELLETMIGDESELLVNSAHPQGGNPISRNPAKGVVDEHFRVYGATGLYVCDASVFPTSITVNPQLTVMALAAYAADEIVSKP
ncbi:GMC family oxidoreductase [Solirubrobacter phytolaccae]|uniref:GMC family oxidoreductase n=1 Tax=Solirubrobacter phytolaccae TaxID=1404360 RepID=A0A9X3N916_9ACTN|nr:GMC family oxidoreductase [Solirubrobacter phytolaccae]MDA0181681.1 GMC family oxidoreductase [Solirubrobacter phytolaccae]